MASTRLGSMLVGAIAVACSGACGPLPASGNRDGGVGPTSCEADSGGFPYITAVREDAGAFLVGAGYAMPASAAFHAGRVYWTALGQGSEGIYSALPNGCDLRRDFAVGTPRFLKFSGDRLTWLNSDQASIQTSSPIGASAVRLGQAGYSSNIAVVGDRVYGMGGLCNLVSYGLTSGDRVEHGPNLDTFQAGYLVGTETAVLFSCPGIGAVYSYDVATSSITTIVRSDFEYYGVAEHEGEIYYAESTCTDLNAACTSPFYIEPGCCPVRIVAFNPNTGERREVTVDPGGPIISIAFAPDGTLYYSGFGGIKRRRPGASTFEEFSQEAIVDQFAFGDGYVFWGNTRLYGDTTQGPGFVMRLPW